MNKVLVILNAAAGTLADSGKGNEADHIRRRFADRGVDAEIRGVEGAKLTDTARAERDSGIWDMIVAGGGDGTLNAVAAGLVGGSTPFGVLPLGTFNHLAKEFGMPLDLDPAIDALVDGETRPMNVGDANGRTFLSFAAIGLYTEMIRHRDAQRRALGRRKMWAGLIAATKMFVRWPLMRVRVTVGGDSFTRVTPTVYVSISDYQIRAMGVDVTPDPARSTLHVYLAARTRRGSALGALLRWFLRRLRPYNDFELLRTTAVELATHGRVIRVGLDGEVVDMEPPLRCHLVEGGLRVRVPRTSMNTTVAFPAP